jgi:D-tyrosyl-tRNA(Tyr) deacylase
VIALLQRVASAHVEVGGETIGAIDHGALLFVCAEPADDESHARRLVDKVLELRIFADAGGKMNRSLRDVGGGLLVVSQFTLAADTSSGRRPSFTGAAPAALGERLYDTVLRFAREREPLVQAGRFGAHMQVHLVNDGPVTIPLAIC